MTQMEESVSLGRSIDEWGDAIFDALKARYSYVINESDETWFLNGDTSFHLVAFVDPLYGFIIEYANGKTERDFSMAIDGRQWPILDYESSEEMLEAMIAEIEADK